MVSAPEQGTTRAFTRAASFPVCGFAVENVGFPNVSSLIAPPVRFLGRFDSLRKRRVSGLGQRTSREIAFAPLNAPRRVTRLRAMITMKTKYALKALCRLASSTTGEPMLIADIAEQEGDHLVELAVP